MILGAFRHLVVVQALVLCALPSYAWTILRRTPHRRLPHWIAGCFARFAASTLNAPPLPRGMSGTSQILPELGTGGQGAPAVPPAPQVSLDVLPDPNVSPEQPNIQSGDSSSAAGTQMVVDEASGSGASGAAATPAASTSTRPSLDAYAVHQHIQRKMPKAN